MRAFELSLFVRFRFVNLRKCSSRVLTEALLHLAGSGGDGKVRLRRARSANRGASQPRELYSGREREALLSLGLPPRRRRGPSANNVRPFL